MPRPIMQPVPGANVVRYVGDRLRFTLECPACAASGMKAFLRTNLTRAAQVREEVIALAGTEKSDPRTFAGQSWRDIPMRRKGKGWELDLPLTEVGYFRAKAYCVDAGGAQLWPDGRDVGVAVHPDQLRSRNTIYCAFPRMFGKSRTARSTRDPQREAAFDLLDRQGYTVIPPSGKLRDLAACVPHIMDTLGCRILHLLPVGPVPTTFARMGRFGSPYALQDLAAIDPALVDFDQRTTGVEQFRELTDAVHLRGGLVFLDIVVNHTGWAARLMEQHPEWYLRNPDGTFHSPGAWGVVWGDLVELDNRHADLWEETAEALLTWCRRGVDGFRCDAGYMVPLPAWQYLVARLRREFPDTVFLLEGLGGAWEATEALLTEGGMQWAYSELFQNYDGGQVSGYLDHAIRQSERLGPLVHYSETHDNPRLAAKGAKWSMLRNRLCALASVCGTFGFTSGVEWLADERFDVHQSRGLNWGAEPNLLEELSRLNRLVSNHPCWFDGARLERLSPEGSPVLALARTSADGADRCLVVVNLDAEQGRELCLPRMAWEAMGPMKADLLGQELPSISIEGSQVRVTLAAASSHCLAPSVDPLGLSGEAYRQARAQAAWAYQQLDAVLPAEALGPADWRSLADLVDRDPAHFLGCLAGLDAAEAQADLLQALERALERRGYPAVVRWSMDDLRRETLVPPGHWVLLEDELPFAATLEIPGQRLFHVRSIPGGGGHVAALPPRRDPEPVLAQLRFTRFIEAGQRPSGALHFLAPSPAFPRTDARGLCLLTNGRGGMARLHGDLGAIASKYDCLLGANLHPSAPCDRHILVKRLRAWANADGFITALDRGNLVSFEPGPPARWVFVAHAGEGRTAEIHLTTDMLPGRNATVLRFERPYGPPHRGEDLPAGRDVRLTVRLDLEDRGFHDETEASPGLEECFRSGTSPLPGRQGFLFRPERDRRLRAWCDEGEYHPEPEWSLALPHPVEASRGMRDRGDAWSPGWFELPLPKGAPATVTASAESHEIPSGDIQGFEAIRNTVLHVLLGPGDADDPFETALRKAASAFLVRRGDGATVIAGYPWFLDWGRDTLIAARGLIAAGMKDEVTKLLTTFASFEKDGTLPNMLSADSTANRDTSDAPLWFALACEEAAEAWGEGLYAAKVDGSRSVAQVLRSIAAGYLKGTPGGVRVDVESGLVWSPRHFTWMDTNYPAATPREGYPIEIQALWIRLLRNLERLRAEPCGEPWGALADRAAASLERFWREDRGFFADTLHAPAGTPASRALADDHLRPNQLFAISLGLVEGARARRAVEACARHLLVPGALRSLAPLPVRVPLPVQRDGRALNDPANPYWGRYEGDEDTRRKPAYHNGTAWVWLLGSFCEALAEAWDRQPAALAAARALLGSAGLLLAEGCAGQLPEILDGDAPHQQRGCDAQAWSATETLRAWLRLKSMMGSALASELPPTP